MCKINNVKYSKLNLKAVGKNFEVANGLGVSK